MHGNFLFKLTMNHAKTTSKNICPWVTNYNNVFYNTSLKLEMKQVQRIANYCYCLLQKDGFSQRKILSNTNFLWSVFSRIRTGSNILSMNRRLRVRENPYSEMFHTSVYLVIKFSYWFLIIHFPSARGPNIASSFS